MPVEINKFSFGEFLQTRFKFFHGEMYLGPHPLDVVSKKVSGTQGTPRITECAGLHVQSSHDNIYYLLPDNISFVP